ncbi:hypothetical protein [Intrasporangium sp. YIM S08009]|uniref:hypothetical protein n=1 Tax=Intrasporangium zincisolvens TaxID=3080018 RepID=UPI002B05FBEB|nr:hypothetical protein [Intrasporangium sp. YIM S08009]
MPSVRSEQDELLGGAAHPGRVMPAAVDAAVMDLGPPMGPRTKGRTMTEPATEAPVLDLLARMTADSVETSSLDPGTLMLVRIAALVAVDAPPFSYLTNLAAASDAGLDVDDVRGVLSAIAPIVGTTRVVAATGRIVEALGVALEVAESEAEIEE